ncbi:DUF6299 family protein [Allorhizocola rhizosphaerae]|uniref:DUF6299 family protein n=1 Tax=Allorhizocola rhizosphaerae TaxID=1872709 RepID=UPI0013C2C2C1|nr:DUF6299 family protein [Allorhizocola rhizosphaerae]
MRRLSWIATAGLTLVTVLVATPAMAAPPANDTFAGAIAIPSLPFSTTLDTSEATTDADDAEANVPCQAPATEASVWYSYTPPADTAIVLDMSAADYEGGFLVMTGAPGSFEIVDCGPDAIAFEAVAGTTYYILVIDDGSTSGSGGKLSFTAEAAAPPPVVTLTVNPTGAFNPADGSATVGGTISCVGEVEFSFIQAELMQKVGRGVVYGGDAFEITCDGTTRTWSATIMPALGTKFAGGKAASFTFGVACGPIFCTEGFVETTIQLKRNG